MDEQYYVSEASLLPKANLGGTSASANSRTRRELSDLPARPAAVADRAASEAKQRLNQQGCDSNVIDNHDTDIKEFRMRVARPEPRV